MEEELEKFIRDILDVIGDLYETSGGELNLRDIELILPIHIRRHEYTDLVKTLHDGINSAAIRTLGLELEVKRLRTELIRKVGY